MAEIIKGVDVANAMRSVIIDEIKKHNLKPTLAVVRVGENPSDLSYEKGLLKQADAVGINVKKVVLDINISQEEFEKEFALVNDDPEVHGILLFRPLPPQLNEEPIAAMINPEKDMDCMSPINWAKLAMGDSSGYAPCTPEAVIQICDYLKVDYQGKNVVIVGHSNVVGRPLGYLMIARDATVTWCHVYTKDAISKCKEVDILVSAAGVPGLIKKAHVENAGKECIVIDVGINFVDGKMCGDVAFEEVEPLVDKITPVPGGVGGVTSVVLMNHVVRAAKKASEK